MNRCWADDDGSVLIAPDGHLGKCERSIDREFFGHIDSEERDEGILCKFKKGPADIEACATCFYDPQCFHQRMCHERTVCTPEKQKEFLYYTRASMKYEYECYLRSATTGGTCQSKNEKEESH